MLSSGYLSQPFDMIKVAHKSGEAILVALSAGETRRQYGPRYLGNLIYTGSRWLELWQDSKLRRSEFLLSAHMG